jgi:hypothetical protein
MIEDDEPSPDEAFDSAHYFAGKKLLPFSFARQTALQRLGVSSSSPVEAAAALVFICLSTPERIDLARGPAGTSAFRLEMQEWADEHKIGIAYLGENGEKLGSKTGHEVRAIADKIWLELSASQSEPDLPRSNEAAPPNAAGRV